MSDAKRYKDPKKRQEYKNAWKREYYANHPEKKKIQFERINNLKRRNKLRAVLLFGGKCPVCGYKKNLAALEFHHPDGRSEDDLTSIWACKWETILQQIKKCALRCSNCHREEHHPELAIVQE